MKMSFFKNNSMTTHFSAHSSTLPHFHMELFDRNSTTVEIEMLIYP